MSPFLLVSSYFFVLIFQNSPGFSLQKHRVKVQLCSVLAQEHSSQVDGRWKCRTCRSQGAEKLVVGQAHLHTRHRLFCTGCKKMHNAGCTSCHTHTQRLSYEYVPKNRRVNSESCQNMRLHGFKLLIHSYNDLFCVFSLYFPSFGSLTTYNV